MVSQFLFPLNSGLSSSSELFDLSPGSSTILMSYSIFLSLSPLYFLKFFPLVTRTFKVTTSIVYIFLIPKITQIIGFSSVIVPVVILNPPPHFLTTFPSLEIHHHNLIIFNFNFAISRSN
jgi:hypothetical protein